MTASSNARPSRLALAWQVLRASTADGGDDLVVTLSVEAYDHYVDWLQAAVLQGFRGTVRKTQKAFCGQ